MVTRVQAAWETRQHLHVTLMTGAYAEEMTLMEMVTRKPMYHHVPTTISLSNNDLQLAIKMEFLSVVVDQKALVKKDLYV